MKNALEIVSVQKVDTLNELDYIESVVYELENSTSINELVEIFEEISENDIFKERTSKYKTKKKSKIKKSSLTKNKDVSFNPIKYNVDGYTVLVKVAKIAALHSKAKNSSNVPVDYCEIRFVKKPSGSKPGMVIYTNNRTLNVTP